MNKIKELFKGRNGIPEEEIIYSNITKNEWERFKKINKCTMNRFGPCVYFVSNKNREKMLEFKDFKFEGD